MAKEITIQAALNWANGGASVAGSFVAQLDQTGNDGMQETQDVLTSATAITMGNITGAPKALLVKNLDKTNYVEIDSANTFDKFPQKVLPGAVILLAPQTATIYGRANTATVKIMKIAAEA